MVALQVSFATCFPLRLLIAAIRDSDCIFLQVVFPASPSDISFLFTSPADREAGVKGPGDGCLDILQFAGSYSSNMHAIRTPVASRVFPRYGI